MSTETKTNILAELTFLGLPLHITEGDQWRLSTQLVPSLVQQLNQNANSKKSLVKLIVAPLIALEGEEFEELADAFLPSFRKNLSNELELLRELVQRQPGEFIGGVFRGCKYTIETISQQEIETISKDELVWSFRFVERFARDYFSVESQEENDLKSNEERLEDFFFYHQMSQKKSGVDTSELPLPPFLLRRTKKPLKEITEELLSLIAKPALYLSALAQMLQEANVRTSHLSREAYKGFRKVQRYIQQKEGINLTPKPPQKQSIEHLKHLAATFRETLPADERDDFFDALSKPRNT